MQTGETPHLKEFLCALITHFDFPLFILDSDKGNRTGQEEHAFHRSVIGVYMVNLFDYIKMEF